MSKQNEYQKELDKWNEIFQEVDESSRKTAEGLIQKAAYLHSMCWELEETIKESGSIQIHPKNPNLQKEVPAVKVYARLSESYANIVNKLNIIRSKNISEDDDEFDEYMQSMKK